MTSQPVRDRGAVLPLVLGVSIFLAFVTIALARLVTADLAFARVTEGRTERGAAALGAIDYGVERIRLGQTMCPGPTGSFGPLTPGLLDRNDATVALTCQRLGANSSEITGWAAVITGEGINNDLLEVEGGGLKQIDGSIYIKDATDIDLSGGSEIEQHGGDLWYRAGSCPTAVTLPGGYSFVPSSVREAHLHHRHVAASDRCAARAAEHERVPR